MLLDKFHRSRPTLVEWKAQHCNTVNTVGTGNIMPVAWMSKYQQPQWPQDYHHWRLSDFHPPKSQNFFLQIIIDRRQRQNIVTWLRANHHTVMILIWDSRKVSNHTSIADIFLVGIFLGVEDTFVVDAIPHLRADLMWGSAWIYHLVCPRLQNLRPKISWHRFVIPAISGSSHAGGSSFFPKSLGLSAVCPSWAAFTSSRALYFLLLFLAALLFRLIFTSRTTATLDSLPLVISSTFSASISLAIFRFCDLDLVAWTFNTRPVGRCFSCTAEAVLFCLELDMESLRWSRENTYNLLTTWTTSAKKYLCEFVFIYQFRSIRHLPRPWWTRWSQGALLGRMFKEGDLGSRNKEA